MLPKWFLLHWRFSIVILFLSAIGIALGLNLYVNLITSSRRYTSASKVAPQPIAIVLGAGIFSDGTPTPMLADRVSAAAELYKQGRVQKLLMSGDNSREDYDEVTAMQDYAVELGVPSEDITLDHAGFSTYESCYRAQKIFGIEQAVIVTQKFHLSRAVYLCNQLDVNAVGLGTPDWEIYPFRNVMFYSLREKFSTLKALWEVHVTRPQPTLLGPFEGIEFEDIESEGIESESIK